MSKKHGKCASGALAPAAPAHVAAARPVMLSSALRKGATAHHEAHPAFSLQELLTIPHFFSESLHPCTQPFHPLYPILSCTAIFSPLPSSLSLFISLYLFPTFSLPIPPSLQYRSSSSLPLLFLPQFPFLLPLCISPPPSPKPAWQNLLQEDRLISIANTHRPPQPDINLHLSVMNISHLPQEGFIQHGRVGSGNVALEHELGSVITYRCGEGEGFLGKV